MTKKYLLGLGATAFGLIVGVKQLALPFIRLKLGAIMSPFGTPPVAPLPKSPLVWCEFDQANFAHLYLPKAELGQGVQTALAQIIAEELELDWQLVVVHSPDTARAFHPELLAVFGGSSVSSLYEHLRKMSATFRELLKTEVARQLGQPVSEIIAEQSKCWSRSNPEHWLTYAEIVKAKPGAWQIPATPPSLKASNLFSLIGHSMPRLDLPAKVIGEAIYGYDVRVEGMLYGAVARPPRYNAKLKKVSPSSIELARRQSGVVKVVIQGQFVGVVAERRSQAYQALNLLDLTWSYGSRLNQAAIQAKVSVPAKGGAVVHKAGNTGQEFKTGQIYQAEYRTGMVMHLPFEPPVAVADVRSEGVTIHTSTQNPRRTRKAVAQAIGKPEKEIRLITPFVGGSFGRKHIVTAAVEAARLAKAVGKPVQVGWTMDEDLRYGYKRPPTHHRLKAKLTPDKTIAALEHQVAAGDAAKIFPEQGVLAQLTGVDIVSAWGGQILYDKILHRRQIYHRTPIALPTGGMRGVGSPANIFATESFMDELAHLAKTDPLEFRLQHLSDSEVGQRLKQVLSLAATKAGWGTITTPNRGQGIACYIYERTVMAEVAEVSVVAGQIQVHCVTCAVDAGIIVNPDGAMAQVEGGVIMGLSWALEEEVKIEDGMMTNASFGEYQILNLKSSPEIEIHFIDSAKPSGGLSEALTGPVAAAVANAVFAVTGQRLRSLPLKVP